MAVIAITGTIGLVLPKRSISDNTPDNYDYYDYPGKYEDYPVSRITRNACIYILNVDIVYFTV